MGIYRMKYLKSSAEYFFDKGPYMVLIAIVPSLLMPFLISPSSALYYLINYLRLDRPSSYAQLYMDMRALPYDYFFIGIIGIVLMMFVVAILFGVVDRHMRVGEFTISFSRAKTRINFNLLTAFKFVFVVAVAFELCNVLISAFYYLWSFVFGHSAAWIVLSVISFLLIYFLFMLFISTIILWPPFMLHTGLSTKEAFLTAWRQISGKIKYVFFVLFLTVLPFAIVMIITGALNCGVVVRTILDGVAYAVAVPIYITVMYNIFYDVTGTERIDLEKVDIWSKKTPKD